MPIEYGCLVSKEDLRRGLYDSAELATKTIIELKSGNPDHSRFMSLLVGTGVQLVSAFVASSQDTKAARALLFDLIEALSEDMRGRMPAAIFKSQLAAMAAAENPSPAPAAPAPDLAARGLTEGERAVLAIARVWFRASRAYCLSFGPAQERAAAEVRDLAGKLYQTMLQIPEFSNE